MQRNDFVRLETSLFLFVVFLVSSLVAGLIPFIGPILLGTGFIFRDRIPSFVGVTLRYHPAPCWIMGAAVVQYVASYLRTDMIGLALVQVVIFFVTCGVAWWCQQRQRLKKVRYNKIIT